MCLSYLSLGVFSVFFQHFDWEIQSMKNNSVTKKERSNSFLDVSNPEANNKSSDFFRHQEDSLENNFCTAPRLYKSQVKYYTKEIETNPNKHVFKIFYIKYKNFICSPRTYFIFEKVIYF